MEPLYKCSYCSYVGTKDKVELHEMTEHDKTDNKTDSDNQLKNIKPLSVSFGSDFEIKRISSNNERYPIMYEIVKWYNTESPVKLYSPISDKEVEHSRFCYVVAFIRFDKKEWDWDFYCVGTRYIDDYIYGMNSWVKSWIEHFRNSKYPELEDY